MPVRIRSWARAPLGQSFALPFAVAFLRGTFQYGDLHLGQTRGSLSFSLGSHSCPHLSQRKPQSRTLTIPGSIRSFVCTVKYHPPRYRQDPYALVYSL